MSEKDDGSDGKAAGMRTLALVGGDARQKFLLSELKRRGYTTRAYGLGEGSETLKSATAEAGTVILPVPATRDGVHIPTPLATDSDCPFTTLLPCLSPRVHLLGGMLPENWTNALGERGIRVTDYFRDETLQLRNALPTAEGALRLAMEALPVTLFGTRVAVIGYGRIGSILTERLVALGAHVTVFARSPVARADARLHGAAAKPAEAGKIILPTDCRAVFNTVPCRLIDAENLRLFPCGCLVMELASAPGGFDAREARDAGLCVIEAPGLPGRFYPETAGLILADAVCAILDANG